MKTSIENSGDNDKIECPNCAELISPRAIMCRFCQTGISKVFYEKCKFCSEMIRKDSTICRFCSSNLVESEGPEDKGKKKGSIWTKRQANSDQQKESTADGGSSKTQDDCSETENQSFKANLTVIRQRARFILAKLQKDYHNIDVITPELQNQVRTVIRDLVNNDEAPLTMMEKGILLQNVLDEVFGFGPLGPLLRDPTVADIFVNAFDQIFVERNSEYIKTSVTFENESHLLQTIEKITIPLGVQFSQTSPIVDARLPNGSRVNATMTATGASLIIRCFGTRIFSLAQLVENKTLSEGMAEVLKACIFGRVNIIVCGASGSGKTSLLNSLLDHIRDNERVITIENQAELRLKKDHWVRLETRTGNEQGRALLNAKMLIQTALRMRPDRLVLGEIRAEESYDFLDAIYSGQSGTLTTIRAKSPADCLNRLETMLLLSCSQFDAKAARLLISNTTQLIVHVNRLSDGKWRIVDISEIAGIEDGKIKLERLFRMEQTGRDENGMFTCTFTAASTLPKLVQQLDYEGVAFDPDWMN